MASTPSTNGTESVIGEFKARRQLLDVFHVENGEFLQRLAASNIDAWLHPATTLRGGWQ